MTADLMDPTLHANGPPHELFEQMRAEEPVRWNETADGGGFWSVTRHADVSAVSRDTATFSSYEAGIFLDRDRVSPLDLARKLLLYKDPPEHTKFRKILQTAFVPHTVAKMEDANRARVTAILDGVIEAGRCDFVEDVAIPMPLGILGALMGLPADDLPRLRRWTDEIEEAQRSPEPAAALGTFAEMGGYLFEQIGRQAEAGTDSIVTTLRAAEVDGERLGDDEIMVFFALLVFAGNDTTRNTAATGLHALLSQRDQWELLCADPSLIPGAVEEILRWTSVVKWFARTATADTELGGQPIAAGDKVVMWYSSASRDDDACPDPGRFDVTREEVAHKAFGGGGRHFCLGAGLARQELKILFEELTRRTPDLELDGPVERLHSNWANSLTAMPVRFTPGPKEAR